ncbi:MAG: tyrosine-type recombinase/integrase [Candidatus Acidiferrales bacterium]
MAVYRRGKIWWFSFEFQGRRVQESSGFTNKTAAQRVEAKRKTDLLNRRAGFSQTKLAPKFEEHVTKFLAWSKQQHRAKTRELHGTNCDTLLRFFRGCWLDEITSGMVEDFKLARAGEARRNAKDGSIIAPATVNRALTTLKKLFHHAEKCGYGISNPTRGVEFLNEGPGRMRVVSFQEEIGYLAAAPQPLKGIAQTILDTGLRPDEVFRIRVENLDFAACTIFIASGKTKAARRKVTMTADVLELLRKRATAAKGSFIFPSKSDPERQIGSVRKAHDAAVEKAGIKDHFRLYDLRHTFATRAVAAGVDLPTLGAILGHTTVQMTMRYVHPAEEQKRVAVGKLEGYRLAGIVEAIEKSRGVTTVSATVN